MLGVHGVHWVHGMWRKSLAEWLRGFCGVFPLGFYLKKKKKNIHKRICRATSGQVGSNSYPEHGLVKDGTPCGDNLICLNQTCVSLFPHVDQTKCPTNKQGQECSEHGVSFFKWSKTATSAAATPCVCVYIHTLCILTCMHAYKHS